MLQYQVSNQLSSLSLQDSTSRSYPIYVSTRDMKQLGFPNFWRSPYNETNTRKRELPVLPPRESLTEAPEQATSSPENKVKGILKNGVLVTGDTCSALFRKRLKRSASFSTNRCGQMSKRVQFDENNRNDTNVDSANLNTVQADDRPTSQCSRISTDFYYQENESIETCGRITPCPVSSRSANMVDNGIQRPLSVLGIVDPDAVKSKTIDKTVVSTIPRTPRIPGLRRSNTTLCISVPSAVEQESNHTTINFRLNPRNNVVNRPRTSTGNPSAILQYHTNFCNREQTIRIIKWLEDVDDKQTKEGKCTELVSNLDHHMEG